MYHLSDIPYRGDLGDLRGAFTNFRCNIPSPCRAPASRFMVTVIDIRRTQQWPSLVKPLVTVLSPRSIVVMLRYIGFSPLICG